MGLGFSSRAFERVTMVMCGRPHDVAVGPIIHQLVSGVQTWKPNSLL